MPLPRGLLDQTIDKPTATARWAKDEEIGAYAHGKGDILLGITRTVHPEAAGLTVKLDELAARLMSLPMARQHPDWAMKNRGALEGYRESLFTERLPVGFKDNRHLMTIAGSRSGKGTSAIIPNLCLYPGSCVVIDPKGENATITAARRGAGSAFCDGMGQNVVVLDPFRVSKGTEGYAGKFNPLDQLKADDPEIVDKASSIADALVVRANDRDAHWDDSARELIKALILLATKLDDPKQINLLTVLHFAREGWHDEIDLDDAVIDEDTGRQDHLRSLFTIMTKLEEWDGAVSGVAASMLSMGKNEYGSVLSTVRRNLSFLEKPGMRSVLEATTFEIDDLKTHADGMTIFLCLPPNRMVDCDRWLRLMIAVSLDRIYTVRMPDDAPGEPAPDDATGTGYPILLLLEEFPVLGYMKLIETAAGFAAGYGVKLWLVVQDLTQLKRHYKEGWETFIGNAGVIQAFGNSDVTTLEYLSKKLGETETVQTTISTTASTALSSNDPSEYSKASDFLKYGGMRVFALPFVAAANQQTSGLSTTTTTASNPHINRTPLIKPDEIERIFRREELTQLVHIKGERPFFLKREEYYNTAEYFGKFDPDRAPRLQKVQARSRAQEATVLHERRRKEAMAVAAGFAKELEAMIAGEEAKSPR